MKKVAIIGTVGVPSCYGGFETLVENLLDATPYNVEYTVFCTSKRYKEKQAMYKGAKLKYLDLDANGKDSIIYDYLSMKMSLNTDVMLILGVSGCIFLPFIRKKFKGKIIVNIDGLEWKRDKWNLLEKWLLHYSEKQAVRFADIVIGDNKAIIDYIKKQYRKKAVFIAYGGDHTYKITANALYEKYPFCKTKYAITVCRIEPENNIHIILKAFSYLPEYKLVIVGNWATSKYGTNLRKNYSKYKNIHILNPIYDNYDINWLRSNAVIYLHGHSAGGTNPSLVETMNLGLPILAFDCVYNRSTTQNKCFYWKDYNDILKLITERNTDFKSIASNMKAIASKEYVWKKIASAYNKLY
ncbi:MAG: DUF1972 domain-containing protein [Treponema sp.]